MLASELIQLENQGATHDTHVNSLLICIHCNSASKKESSNKINKMCSNFSLRKAYTA